ncbi:hypothetical protein BH11ARM2_BH11ARM2_13870 [soil metagenome]
MDRFTRFVDAYNDIDEFLRERLGEGDGVGFGVLLRTYAERYRLPVRDVELIRLLSGLRNELIHSTSFSEPLIEPSEAAVARIEALREGLLRPIRAIDRHRKPVATLSPHDPLERALEMAENEGFNVFPAYENGHYRGLVTPQGIVRLVARKGGLGIEKRRVAEVLALDPKRVAGRLIPQGTPLHEAEAMFSQEPLLQAVILTPNGRESEPPTGILTAADAGRS